MGDNTWPWGRFWPAFLLAPLTGVGCGVLACWLILRARASCDTAQAPGDGFGLLFLELPLLLLVSALASPIAAGVLWRLVRPGSWRAAVFTVVPIALEVALLVGWAAFAVIGTPDGYPRYPGDPVLCPAGNIPPWWPSWIPA
ncbi:hypothetical protein [Streptomyces aculeolatus]|uniref:hypothetical protein n=1 Tax=Streptomyces aculeolatus TaxID=270689 RepID=UPI001CED2252|nr:hypothetical protein [Streptomyces aculeolatus]